MITLGIFSSCPNCTWWLLPLLFFAWLLGWLLWSWTKGSSYRSEIDGLHGDIKSWKSKFSATENDLSQARFEREKLSGEHATLQSKLSDYNVRYRALEGKYNNAITDGGGSGEDVDTSQWTNKIGELESQLEVSRNTNLKLQDDYSTLKSRFNDMQIQLENTTQGEGLGIVGDTVSSNTEDLARIAELEKELEAATASNSNLQADIATLSAQAAQIQSRDMDSGESEDYLARITDLEKKLAISYETNTRMESDYAHLKSNLGNLEMRLQETPEDNSAEIEGYQTRIFELEQLLAARPSEDHDEPGEGKKKKKKKKKKKNKNKKKGKKKKDEKVKQGSGKKSGYGVAFGDDNLQIVEGIGPKIESILKSAGVNSWLELANAEPEKLTGILTDAGPRYKMHNPSTWPEQAELAHKGDWTKLVKYQKVLGGAADKESDSKVEKLYAKAMGFKTYKANDLKVIEGVGPKIEELLKNAGMTTWKKLSESKVEDIQKVLDAAGSRYKLANPGTWAKQAKMAADGDWQSLKAYQDELDGGKE